jgi:hypothetical protein
MNNIYYFTPYKKHNLGEAYNHYCSLVPNDNDWITLMDGDVMQLHCNWGDIWSSIINQNEDAGIISGVTNRVAFTNKYQLCHEMFKIKNILLHKKYALSLFDKYKYNTINLSNFNFLSGFYFSFKKSTWKLVSGFKEGILDVDTDFFSKVSKHLPCKIAKGFYLLHYYRMLEDIDRGRYTDHLI